MKKGRNNEGSSRRFTLSKSKILRGRTNFQRLFDDKAIAFKSANVQIRFRIYNGDEPDCKIAFIVPKRLGKAVRRNRMKRWLKEAYRLNQYVIAHEAVLAKCVFHGALMARTVDAEYDEITSEVIDLLNQVQNFVHTQIE